MRILFHSNDPSSASATGYSSQTKLFVPKLFDLGYEVLISTFYGADHARINWGGIPILPKFEHPYGADAAPMHYRENNCDILISLMDSWVLRDMDKQGIRWTPWFPIDSQPLSPPVRDAVVQSYERFVISKFGQRMLEDAGIESTYIPHGVDTKVYKPHDRAKSREILDLPNDAFVIGMVAANKGAPSRKAFGYQIEAFRMFHEKHPDSLLHIHTLPDASTGENLAEYVNYLGLNEAVRFPNPYQYRTGVYTEPAMAHLYSSFDVLSHVSAGEGFGICYLPGSRVITDNGFKPIETLTTADWVQTHRGHTRDIMATSKRLVVDEPIVEVTATGNTQPQSMTLNHPVYAVPRNGRRFTGIRRAYRRGEIEPDWLQAGELQEGDFLVMPRRQWSPVQSFLIDVGEFVPAHDEYLTSAYTNQGSRTKVTAAHVAQHAGVSVTSANRVLGNYTNNPATESITKLVTAAAEDIGWKPAPQISRYMPLNEDTGFLIGQYIAEGSIGANGQIEFASHARERNVRDRLARVVRDVWGKQGAEEVNGNRGRFTFTCKPLAKFIGQVCGRGARNKQLPPFVFDNADFGRGVLIGAWTGDGSFSSSPEYCTVSEQLAYQLRQLLSAVGFYSTITTDVSRHIWRLFVSGSQESSFCAMFGRVARNKVQRLGAIAMDGYWLVPVREIKRHKYTGYVHNIQVAEDESYCVEGYAAHNCQLEAQACGTPVINGDWTAMSELCFAGWKVDQSEALKWWTPHATYMWWPKPEAIADRYEQAYTALQNSSTRRKMSKKARRKALAYDVDRVTETYWKPALIELEQRIAGDGPEGAGPMLRALMGGQAENPSVSDPAELAAGPMAPDAVLKGGDDD